MTTAKVCPFKNVECKNPDCNQHKCCDANGHVWYDKCDVNVSTLRIPVTEALVFRVPSNMHPDQVKKYAETLKLKADRYQMPVFVAYKDTKIELQSADQMRKMGWTRIN